MVVEETTFQFVLQWVVVPVELQVVHITALDSVTEALSSLEDRALRESRVLVLTILLLLLPLVSPLLSRWLDTGSAVSLTPVSDHLLIPMTIDVAGSRPGGHMDHGLRMLAAHDRASPMVLQPQPHELQGVHHIWGQWSG